MMEIQRFVYRTQCKSAMETLTIAHFTAQTTALKQRIMNGTLMTAAVFQWQTHFFVYYESLRQPLTPSDLFGDMRDLLEAWPGEVQKRTFVPMLDIFHCQEPANIEHWRRKQPPERLLGRITRLKPNMGSSYIFYHYQLQEERPGSFDKYGLIAMHENLLFFYQELPAIVETPPIPGKLTTANTPPDWQAVMFPHFTLWENAKPGQEIWQEIDLLLYIS